MNAQEQQLIDELVQRIRSTTVENKDAAAEQRLQQGLAGYPDAVYVLAQTVLVQKYGLEQATQRIQDLQAKLEEAQTQLAAAQKSHTGSGSFLSQIFGGDDNPAPQAPPTPVQASNTGWQNVSNPQYPQTGQVPMQPVPYPVPVQGYPAPPSYPGAGYGGGFGGGGFGGGGFGGGGGFMQSALQTAAGVAMGEMVFQGAEDLFSGLGHHSGYGQGFEGSRPSETIINNYNDGDHDRYDDRDRSSEHEGRGLDAGTSGDRNDSSFYNPADDASRSNEPSGSRFADTGDTGSSVSDRDDDTGSFTSDDSDSSSDDSSGFDSGDNASSSDDSNY